MSNKDYAKRRTKEYGMALSQFAAWQYPDVMLGSVPLYNVQFYEVAISQDILKYRAVGSQFLAKQKGGNYAFRIDAILPGTDASVYLTALQAMFIHGKKQEELNDGIQDAITKGSDPFSFIGNNLGAATPNPDNIPLNDNSIMTSPSNYNWLKSDKFETFTVMTRDVVLFDMYIESMIYWRTTEDDPNVIHITVLLRKFIQPRRIVGNYLYRYKMAEIVPYSSIQPNSAEEIENIPHSHTNKFTGRYIQYQDIYPAKYELIETIISTMHYQLQNMTRYSSKYETLKDRSIRDAGVYNFLFKVDQDKYHKLGDAIENVDLNIVDTTATTTEGMSFERLRIIDAIKGSVFKIKDGDSVTLVSENFPMIDTDTTGGNYGVSIGSGVSLAFLYQGGSYRVRYKRLTGSRTYVEYYIARNVWYAIKNKQNKNYYLFKITTSDEGIDTVNVFEYGGDIYY